MTLNNQSIQSILVTTSRNPSRRTRTLIKDMTLVLPRTTRVVRGTQNTYELAEAALNAKARLLIIVSTRKGNPGKMTFFRVSEQLFKQIPLELLIRSVKLRYEMSPQKTSRPDNIFILPTEGLSPRAQRLCEQLSIIFKTSLIDGSQIVGKSSNVMRIEESKNIITINFSRGANGNDMGPLIRIGKVRLLEHNPM